MWRTSPAPPTGDGHWTLLQLRTDSALWQWDRSAQTMPRMVTRYVITNEPSRLDFDDIDEAEVFFQRLMS